MKKRFLLSLVFALNVNIMNATTPYYMQNPDSSKIDAIKTDDASCGTCGGCGDSNGGNFPSDIFQVTQFISLISKNQADSYAKQNCNGCGNGNCTNGDNLDLPSIQ